MGSSLFLDCKLRGSPKFFIYPSQRRKKYDSLPYEIILHILSLLPLDCVFRLKCVCKAWSVLISEFGTLHLKRLRETSHGIICLHTHRNSRDCKISFEIRSLQVGGGFKTLLEKDLYTSNIYPQFRRIGHVYSLDGLICLSDGQGFDVFNPTTGEFVSLQVRYNDCTFSDSQRRSIIVFGFGYFPLTKQYNVLSIYSEFMAAIITVGHSNSSWRIIFIDIPTSYHFSNNNETFCINGNLYWLDYHHIAAFNAIFFSRIQTLSIFASPNISVNCAE
ncbi:F-box protein At2g07140-like [Quercus lobata]|uniref:F-box protein At2g07140-like n=1 Tax=Quercus lobata TaxID=97700 RepID=UPI001245288B|nr:F-box protein At2g07140-like [Quercus lobata]